MTSGRLSALVLGGANTLPDDKAAALELFEPGLVIACNHAGRDEDGRVDHWCTMHPALFPMWIETRRAAGHPDAGALWHARNHTSPVDSQPVEPWGGSSGMLCVKLALDLGCKRIVLAGVPMLKLARHYDRDKPWMEARQYWPVWERRAPEIAPFVRSCSGWTRDLLGAPTAEWLNGDGS